MKFLVAFHFLLGAAGTVILAYGAGEVAAKGFALGAGVSWFNLLSLVLTWPWILAKKLVALSVGVIVLKFAILGSIVYVTVFSRAVDLGWFAAGLTTVVVSVVVTAFVVSRESPEKAER